ncbi:HPP family protein [Asticcacaulis sp. 201]|uniref:HPP family protein n=1 Tax=Asticcacaulis sp. 201 TaxID=3028787 RepID=UPI0029169E62|nr:HPP family protein [Asticcacaulis sp. 201]MDV6331563.1 HPP family protein [Asticcacaulis sp. 201]
MKAFFEAFIPPPTRIDARQRAITMGGAFVGILLTAVVCGLIEGHFDLKWWLMAPLGASAAQVFAVPGSPMSQPWPIVGGHLLSALAGLACVHLIGVNSLSAGLAVGLAVMLMLSLRALHPSGGGTALFIVISHTSDWHFILFPVIANAVLLVVLAIAWHRLTGQGYPQRQTINGPHQLALHRFNPSDLEAALLTYNQALDISREDVEKLIELTEMQAYQRLAGEITCGAIMSRKLRTIMPRTRLGEAEVIMLRHDIKALPVLDDDRRPIGLLRLDDTSTSDRTLTADKIMRQSFARVKATDPATECLHILARGDRRHVLVVDADSRLEGLISKSDLMRALFHAG